MDFKLKGETERSLRYSILVNNINLALIPDFTGYDAREGLLCYGIKYGKSIGFELDINRDATIINQLIGIENSVKTGLANISKDGETYELDVGCIRRFNKGGKDRLSIWCDIIRTSKTSGKPDRIYTKIYDGDCNSLSIDHVNGDIIARPSFVFQLVYSKAKNIHTLQASIDQLCIVSRRQSSFKMTPTK